MKKLTLILSIILSFAFAGTGWARQGRVPGAYIVKEVPSSPLATTNVHKIHNINNALYTIDENGLTWVLAGSGATEFETGVSTPYIRFTITPQTSDVVLTATTVGPQNIDTSSGTVHVEIPAPSTANAGLVLGPLMRDGSSGVSVWTQSGSIDYGGISATTWYNHSSAGSGAVFSAIYGESGNSIFIINLTDAWGARN